jgi:hypothetical protein
MKFFFADSLDIVDRTFDFDAESRGRERIRQRSDAYAHELFTARAYDGLLISKGIVESGRYSIAQRNRLMLLGAKEFFRVAAVPWGGLPIMGDCGAFTYVREERPPFTVDQVLSFYVDCDVDLAMSVDHVILAYRLAWDDSLFGVPSEIIRRRELTIELAHEFLERHRAERLRFVPLGVAQGWSPRSYAASVKALQAMGYAYIALGGMVPLKTPEILACLEAISEIREPSSCFHLLGVTRLERITTFGRFGVVSFDTTSPLRQAFKDADDNYYMPDRTYTAIRVPQVDANPKLQRLIMAGKVQQSRARALEQKCLATLRDFEQRRASVDETVAVLRAYEALHSPEQDHTEPYREVLTDRPWEQCGCDICKHLGIHVMLFRGAERNRRRGFHNLLIFYRRLQREIQVHE